MARDRTEKPLPDFIGGAAPAAAEKVVPTNAQLTEVSALGQRLVHVKAAKAALESMLSVLDAEKKDLETRQIPDRLMELGLSSVGLTNVDPESWLRTGGTILSEAGERLQRGAEPEVLEAFRKSLPKKGTTFSIEVRDFVHANISADWEPERRDEAFRYLEELEATALIKVQVSALFGKGEWAAAQKAAEAMRKALGKKSETTVEVAETVPWNTLTAFVREEVLTKQSPLDLQKLGAVVGKVATLVTR